MGSFIKEFCCIGEMKQRMEFIEILECALTVTRLDHVGSGSINSLNKCTATSTVNPKRLEEV